MPGIEPNEVYTSFETEKLLKLSRSTVKRMLKNGFIRANKVGGQYRIFGHELLKLLSPEVDKKAVDVYQQIKKKTKEKIKYW